MNYNKETSIDDYSDFTTKVLYTGNLCLKEIVKELEVNSF